MPLGLLKSAKNRGHRSVMTSEAKSEKVAMIESASSQRLLPTSPESVAEQAFIYSEFSSFTEIFCTKNIEYS